MMRKRRLSSTTFATVTMLVMLTSIGCGGAALQQTSSSVNEGNSSENGNVLASDTQGSSASDTQGSSASPEAVPSTAVSPKTTMPAWANAPVDVAAPPKDAAQTQSGLASKVIKPSTLALQPDVVDTVKVHFTGWTTDGKMFDSSRERGEPSTFSLRRVIAGLTEGIQLMKKGEERRFWIPKDLAYRGHPSRPHGMLVFDVELLDIFKPPKTPQNLAKPPRRAKKTNSGLRYQVLVEGAGSESPSALDSVEVHYSGWTTDGQLFDSSLTRGKPARFTLNRVIQGWTEGMQLMKKGDKFRFWIPEDLAYKGRPDAPAGMLVFDIELIDIERAPANQRRK